VAGIACSAQALRSLLRSRENHDTTHIAVETRGGMEIRERTPQTLGENGDKRVRRSALIRNRRHARGLVDRDETFLVDQHSQRAVRALFPLWPL
jgi:hypothetical protein